MNRRRLLSATALAFAGASAYALACGPFLTEYRSVTRVHPAHPDSYRAGQVGVVRPRFARRYLVQAYRRFTEQPAIEALVETTPRDVYVDRVPPTPVEQWLALRASVGADPQAGVRQIQVDRRLADYRSIVNCLDDAFASAVTTGKSRVARYGPSATVARDWFAAQDAVFENCDGQHADPVTPGIPDPASTVSEIRMGATDEVLVLGGIRVRIGSEIRGK